MSHYVLNFRSLTDLVKKQNILNFGEGLFILLCSIHFAAVSEISEGTCAAELAGCVEVLGTSLLTDLCRFLAGDVTSVM